MRPLIYCGPLTQTKYRETGQPLVLYTASSSDSTQGRARREFRGLKSRRNYGPRLADYPERDSRHLGAYSFVAALHALGQGYLVAVSWYETVTRSDSELSHALQTHPSCKMRMHGCCRFAGEGLMFGTMTTKASRQATAESPVR